MTMRGLLPAVFVLGLSTSALAGADAAKDDAKNLEGTWLVVSAEVDSVKLPEETAKSIKLVLKGDHYQVILGEGTDEGTFKVLPDKSPKAMDITGTKGPNKGKTYKAIYELKDDTLKICYGLDGKQRPTDFSTKADSKRFLVTYKRQKR
jgi:uncharacterized protein (TIGR03067 family)